MLKVHEDTMEVLYSFVTYAWRCTQLEAMLAMLQGAAKPDGKSECTFDEFAGPSRGLRKSETGMK
jgi:hypothetical protein